MKKYISLFLTTITLISSFCFQGITSSAAIDEYKTYTVTVTENADGTFNVVVTIPAGIEAGRIVISVTNKLQLVPGSVESNISGEVVINENYDRDGVTGAGVSFANHSPSAENEIVLKATYTANGYFTADDFSVPIWELVANGNFINTQDDGDVIMYFFVYLICPTYTVTVTENADGTVTIKAAVPDENIDAGKIVVSVSDKLTLIPNSLKSSTNNSICNENYNRDGVSGACVTFATMPPLSEGTIVFEATYTVESGKNVSLDDVTVPSWNMTANNVRVSGEENRDVIKKLIHNFADDWKSNDSKHWHECTVCGFKTDEQSHFVYTWSYDDDYHWRVCDICDTDFGREAHTFVDGVCQCGAEEYEKGDVNGDDWVDNTDAIIILKYDAGVIDLDNTQLAAADVNGDGYADNTDAIIILKYDAGILDQI